MNIVKMSINIKQGDNSHTPERKFPIHVCNVEKYSIKYSEILVAITVDFILMRFVSLNYKYHKAVKNIHCYYNAYILVKSHCMY